MFFDEPVTPVVDTQYRNPLDCLSICAIRTGSVVGVTRRMLARLLALKRSAYLFDSSKGSSGRIIPSTPARAAAAKNFASPYAKIGLRYPIRTRGMSELRRI